MKILIVSQYYYPERFKVTDLAEELFARGNHVDVLTGLPNYPEGKIPMEYRFGKKRHEIINGVNVIRVPLIARSEGKFRLALNYVSYAFNATIKSLFLKEEYDLVLVYQLSPILMALPAIAIQRRMKIPLIMYTFDLWPDSISTLGIKSDTLFYKTVKSVSKWIYRQADVQWVSSASFTGYLERFIGLEIDILHLPQYAEEQFLIPPKPPQQEFICVFAGNIGKAQDLQTVLYAAKQLEEYPDIRIELVGTGSDLEHLKVLSAELKLTNVTFAGAHSLEEMPVYYKKADLFLVSLIDDPIIARTLPGKVQSYMAAGKPIVAAVGGETAHVLQESGGGRFGESGDISKLSENILYYYQYRDQVVIDGTNGRNYYLAHFNRDKFYDTLIEQLNLTIQGGKKHV